MKWRARKLRRELIHERYSGLIEALYGTSDHCDTRIEVKYQDGTTSRMTSKVLLNRMGAA